jgi:hypothetical protein
MKSWTRFEILKNKVVKFIEMNYKEKDRKLNDVKHSFTTDFEHYTINKF